MKTATPIAAALAASTTLALGLATAGAARADSCPCHVRYHHRLTRAYYTPSWTAHRRVRPVRYYARGYGPPPVYAEAPAVYEGPAYAPAWAEDAVAYAPEPYVEGPPAPVYYSGPVRVRYHAANCHWRRHHDDDR